MRDSKVRNPPKNKTFFLNQPSRVQAPAGSSQQHQRRRPSDEQDFQNGHRNRGHKRGRGKLLWMMIDFVFFPSSSNSFSLVPPGFRDYHEGRRDDRSPGGGMPYGMSHRDRSYSAVPPSYSLMDSFDLTGFLLDFSY